jgi:hypothetical protein
MKKTYALLLALAAFSRLDAQVVVNVNEPLSIEGSVESTWADPNNGWGTPDMTLLANGITDTLALAFDGSATADSLCCEAIINRSEIEGKIAVLYRGACNFSLKALNCQDSGAVAVIIINNTSAAPIVMGAGDYGADVTIPTFLVEQAGGQAIAAALANGETVVAYLGNKTGLFDFDLGFTKADILVPPSAGHPAILAQNASEYSPVLGAWVRNYGALDQINITLNVTVDQLGVGEVYNETSSPVDILTGDSAFIQLPALALASYGGHYTIDYTTASPAAEEYPGDNSFSTTLNMGDVYSLGRLDSVGDPLTNTGSRPNAPTGTFTYCVHFRDANASRVAATGIYAYAAVNDPASLAGEILTVSALEWNDVFTGLSDPAFDIATLNEVGSGELIIDPDTTRYEAFVPFSSPVTLVDDQRYLFCVANDNSTVVFLGSQDELDYETNEEVLDQPTSPLQDGTQWSIGFAGTTSANAVKMIDVNTIGIQEQPQTVGTPFPNPTADVLNIPFKGAVNNATLNIMDIAGKVINSQRVSTSMGKLVVNVDGIAPGAYTFSLQQAAGHNSTFKVVVSR